MKPKITLNPDEKIVEAVKLGLKEKGGYCPCRLGKDEKYKCICEEFREQINDPDFEGYCHCMLYYKAKGSMSRLFSFCRICRLSRGRCTACSEL